MKLKGLIAELSIILIVSSIFFIFFFFSTDDLKLRIFYLLVVIAFILIYRLRVKIDPLRNISTKRVFFIVLILSILATVMFVESFPYLGGDEPHYLVVAQSIYKDHDLDLKNQYENKDYFIFHPVTLNPHIRRIKNKQYSIHSYGMGFILVPVYAFISHLKNSSYFFKTLILRLYTLIFGLTFFYFFLRYIKSRVNDENLNIFISGFFFFSPIFFFSIHLFPEGIGILLSFLSFYLFEGGKGPYISSIPLFFMVFFHSKFIVIEFGIILIFLIKKGFKFFLKSSIVVILSYAVNSIFIKVLYGTFSPTKVYDGKNFIQWLKVVAHIPLVRRIETFLSYFLSQRDGLLFYFPLFFSFFFTSYLFKRDRKSFSILIPLIVYSFFYAFLTVRGAYSPPARPIAPLLWTLVILIINWLTLHKDNKETIYPLFLFSIIVFSHILYYPLFLYQQTTAGTTERAGLLFSFLSNMYIDFPKILPSFLKSKSNIMYLPNYLWIFTLIVLAFLSYKNNKFLKNITYYSVIFVILISRVFFPYPQLRNPKIIRGVPFIFYNLSRNIRVLNSKGGFFIVRNKEKGFDFLFSSRKKLKDLKLYFGNQKNEFNVELKTLKRHYTFKNVREKFLTVKSPHYYKKSEKYIYFVHIKFTFKKHLRKYPFVIKFLKN